MIEWGAVSETQQAAFSPKHAAVAGWKNLVNVLHDNRPRAPSVGLAPVTQQTQKDFKANSIAECTGAKTFSMDAKKSTSRRMTRDMLCKKTEAWQTSGTFMMVTSCVTPCWSCKPLTQPALRLERNETNKKKGHPLRFRPGHSSSGLENM